MRIPSHVGHFASGAVAIALLAGCSGGGTQLTTPGSSSQGASRQVASASHGFQISTFVGRPDVAPAMHPVLGNGFVDPSAGKAAEYAADYGASTVTAFNAKGKQTAQLTASNGIANAQGLTGDSKGNVYIANTTASDILVYDSKLSKLGATLSDPGQYPTDVSVDSKTGVVGVTNIISTSGTAGSAVFYAAGKTTPCATVTASNWFQFYFGAFDDKGNLYVDGHDPSGNTVIGVIKGGCKATTVTTLTGASISFPGGIQVSPSDKILIDDQNNKAVYTFKAPKGTTLGSPTATTPLSSAGDPVTISLSSKGTDVWEGDASNNNIEEYAYPKGGSSIHAYSPTGASQVIGVYVAPDEQP